MMGKIIRYLYCLGSVLAFFLLMPRVFRYGSTLSLWHFTSVLIGLFLVLVSLPMLIYSSPEKVMNFLKRMLQFIRTLLDLWSWYREKVHGVDESILLMRVALWSAVLVPYYYKRRSMPGFLKALTPGSWPNQELTLNVDKKLRAVNAFAVGVLNQYEHQRTHMCFRRSLIIYHFLRKEGVPARWFLGVRSFGKDEPRPPGFSASDRYIGHAWVEINGKHYMDENDGIRHYNISFSYPDEEKYAEEVRRVYVKTNLEDLDLPHLTDLGGDGDVWFE